MFLRFRKLKREGATLQVCHKEKNKKKAMRLRYLLGISLDTAPSEGKKKKKKKSLFAIPGGRGIVRIKDVFAA